MTRLPPALLQRPVAHRGLHNIAEGVVENTLPAMIHAAQAGYAVELDVQLSADGEAVVFHDDDLMRLADRPEDVRDLTAGELATLHLGGAPHGAPALAEVLEALGADAPVLVELKDQARHSSTVGQLEARVAQVIAASPAQAAVMSFSPASMIWFAEYAPDAPRGLVASAFDDDDSARTHPAGFRRALADLDFFRAARADFVSYNAEDLPARACDQLRTRGVPIFCWTIRSPQAERKARAHADNITFEGYRAETPGA